MSGAIPWSVKGINPKAREAAREAARRQGLTIGEWLNQAILANEAALAEARGERAPETGARDQSLSDALRQLAERMEVDDHRNALAMTSVDRTLVGVAARVERAEAEARSENGRISDLLDELRDAQSVLLEQMQRIEDEDMPALRAELAADRIAGVEGDLHTLSARALAAETATGDALAQLDGAVHALDAKLADAVSPERLDEQAAALRDTFEAGLDTMTQDVKSMIAETRADIAGQIVAALGGLQPEEMNEALADMSRRLTAAERRHTQTIEAVSIEIKRLSESLDRRLRVVEARNDDSVGEALREEVAAMSRTVEQRLADMETHEAAAFSRMGEEVGRIAERLDVRVSGSEARSAEAIEQVGEQVALMAERLGARQDKLAAELSERIVQSEERQGGRLSQALSSISARLGAIETNTNETLSPVTQAMDSFAARLKAIESQTGAPVVLPDVEPTLAPAYLDAPVREPEPAPRSFGLEHEHDLHARTTRAPEPFSIADDEPVYETSTTEAREPVYLEDIEAEFERRGEDPAFEPKFELPSERATKHLDDPFADIEAAPPEDEEDLFWSTGKPEDEPPLAPRPEPYRLPRAQDEESEDGEPLGKPAFGLDDDFSATSADRRTLLDEDDIERDMFGAENDSVAAPREDYLAAARRAAQANAAAAKPSRAKKEAPAPAAGLRGVSRVVLWGAAGALAAALAGGVYAYNAARNHPPEPRPRKDAALTLAPAGSIAEGAALAAQDRDATATPEHATPVSLTESDLAHAGPADDAPQPASAMTTTIESAAAHGDAVAQYEVALSQLAAGDGANGVAMLRKSAEQGLAMAQYRLAKLYERGEGVTASLPQARQWTERAAIAGNRKAMHDLGVYYARGEGAPFDEAAAFKWFRQAAEYGVTDSQFNLGVLYAQGRGAPPDSTLAYYWFAIAAAGGDGDARARASMIAAQMDPALALQLKARVKAFKARPIIARANGEFGPQPWAPAGTLQAAAADGSPRT